MNVVEEFILEHPKEIQNILKKLRFLILASAPQLTEKISHGIPFFSLKKRIFYLNPGKNHVDLGFCDGHLLSENPLLETKNRTQIKTIRFNRADELNETNLLPVIHEAILIQTGNYF